MKLGLQSVFGAALSVLCLGQATAGIVPARAGETTLPADAGKVMISRVAADVFAQSGLLASTAERAQRKFLSARGEVITLPGQAEYSALNAEQRAALVGRIRGALDTAETVVMAPVYAAAKSASLANAFDVSVAKALGNGVSFLLPDDEFIRGVFLNFGESVCDEGEAPKVIWFSGHARGGDASDYALIGDLSGEDVDAKAGVRFVEALGHLSASDCHFVVGVDADPPKSLIRLPKNVSVIWAHDFGGTAFNHSEKGGVLSQAFTRVLTTGEGRRFFSVQQLEVALRAGASAFIAESSGSASQRPFIQGRERRVLFFPLDTLPRRKISVPVPAEVTPQSSYPR